jgi:SAM-dependent methyltransferase
MGAEGVVDRPGDDVALGGLAAIRTFFASRAAQWEDRFPDDGPAYQRAVAQLDPIPAGVALDAGCGSGRALELLRNRVGPAGLVIGLDVTPEMLAEAIRRGRRAPGSLVLVLGDAWRLPLADGAIDAVLAAGLLPHLAEPSGGLIELARVTRPGGRLAVFHPVSRAALAARHGRVPSDDDAIAPARLLPTLSRSGWVPVSVDDGDDRFLVVAARR